MKRLLSKEEQCNLMFQWNEDPSLALIYKTFDNFVRSRVGDYQKPFEKE